MDEKKLKNLLVWRIAVIAKRIQDEEVDPTIDMHEIVTKLEALVDKRTKKVSAEDLEEWFKLQLDG